MKKQKTVLIVLIGIALLLCALLLILSGKGADSTGQTTEPPTQETQDTVIGDLDFTDLLDGDPTSPETTVPETTVPETTVPATDPTPADPPVTQPATTEPETTEAETTQAATDSDGYYDQVVRP